MKTNSITQLLKKHRIVIPPIQRDYAQGRSTGKVPRIRSRFLDDIARVLGTETHHPLELDFVYGYIENDRTDEMEVSVFKPLDGQQRLTTLFLIHWYAAKKEGSSAAKEALLKNFSYATRQSSRSFCERLVTFNPDFNKGDVTSQIVDQPWCLSSWLSDPTISSMLVMLKEIDSKIGHIEDIWGKLTGPEPKIVFHLLSMGDLGLPEDLYIKMNARGKDLTDFEHFKSHFTEVLPSDCVGVFANKVDKEWSDLFWNVFKNQESVDIAKVVDNGFLSFFWYITDLLIGRDNISLVSDYWVHKIESVYGNKRENVKFLFNSLDLFEKLEREEPGYFDEIFYTSVDNFSVGKTRIFFNNPEANLFRKCADTYGFEGKKNTFSVGEQLLLYAFILMHIEKKEIDLTMFRLLRNIFSSSEDQLRNEYLSAFLYADVLSLINGSGFSANSKLSKRQLEEEKSKRALISTDPSLEETIYRLEDHTLLRGNIALFDINPDIRIYAEQFHKAFRVGCDYFEISKAMLTVGDYTQEYGKFRRFGNRNNSTWREIFTQSESRKGFENTKQVLKSYLDILIGSPNATNSSIISDYLSQFDDRTLGQPLDFRYYYINYSSFTSWNGNQTDGFYWWNDYTSKPYECTMLFKTNYRGRHWSPFLLELSNSGSKFSLENFGNNLQFTEGELILLINNVENGFKITAKDNYSQAFLDDLIKRQLLKEGGFLEAIQNMDGVDTTDRIALCIDFFRKL